MIKNLMNIASEKINHYVSISISIDMNYFVARCQFFFFFRKGQHRSFMHHKHCTRYYLWPWTDVFM